MRVQDVADPVAPGLRVFLGGDEPPLRLPILVDVRRPGRHEVMIWTEAEWARLARDERPEQVQHWGQLWVAVRIVHGLSLILPLCALTS